jgi:hypothetical protein
MRKYKLIFIWLLVAMLFLSCVDNQFDLDRVSSQGELTPYVDVPLGSTSISMKDLLEKIDPNTYVKTGVDNILYFDYLDTLYSMKASQLNLLPNQGPQAYSITVPGMVVPSSGIVIKQTYNFSISLGNNASFSTAYLKTGNINVSLANVQSGISVALGIPGLTHGTIPFSQNLATGSNQISLAGDSLKVDNSDPNNILLPITFTLTATAGAVVSPGSVAVNVGLNNLSFSIVKGNIGTNEVLNKSGSVSLSMFNNSFIKDITFTDPQFSIITENSYGASVKLTLSNVEMQTSNGSFVATFSGNSSTSFNIDKATSYGAVVSNTNTFTRSNTTLFNALTLSPQNMSYTLVALTNPNGGANSDFALDTSQLNVYAKIHIPIKFSASSITLQPDTIDFDFDKYYDAMKHADSAKFVLETSNEFPLTTSVALAAVDENYQFIMKIYDGVVLKSGVPNTSNPQTSTATVSKTESVNLTNADIEKLKNCKHFLVYTTIGTSGTATIYNNYKLSLKLSVLAKARIKF